jgi:phage I-like protein
LARKRTAPPKLSGAPAPVSIRAALQRIAELVGRGSPAARVSREAEAVISSWSTSLDPEETRERMEEAREQLAAGIEAAEEQASEIEEEGKGAVLAASRTLAALAAARDAFGRTQLPA